MAKEEYLKHIEELISSTARDSIEYVKVWKEHVLFTWQWWFSLILFIVPIIVWFIIRKKNSTDRLLYPGFLVLLLASWLDFMGNNFGLWYYPYKLFPSIPPYIPFETFIVFEVMLLLQYKPKSSPFLKALVLGLFNSFVSEPLMRWLGIYVVVHWSSFISLPIYIALYLLADYFSKRNNMNNLDVP
ncbi:MAG: hypothetical protein K0S39_1576 [Paenibacillus sp.]|jgi:hypothetical protein|nr:hypothetical protein [Paenibacillus sp.]